MTTPLTPLFPLNTVLFPQGRLALKVFEARYLDLMSRCLRDGSAFGVVALRQGAEVQQGASAVQLESTGTLARVIDVDMPQPGIMHITAQGMQRFALQAPRQAAEGLWMGQTDLLPLDALAAPRAEHHDVVQALQGIFEQLREREALPAAAAPFDDHFDDIGWVANRWCELLPIATPAKLALLVLNDPSERLQLVERFLLERGVLKVSPSTLN
jgi:uncharacterized protein